MAFRSSSLVLIIFFLFNCLNQASAQKVNDRQSASQRNLQRVQDSIREARQHSIDSARESRQHILDSTKAERARLLDSAKVSRAHILDSTKAERIRLLDSAKASRAHILDSTKAAREHTMDSIQAVRKHFTDSLAAIRKYKESKRYRDSVERARETKLKAIQAKRQATLDSIKAIRKHQLDSAIAVRKKYTDSIKAIQKKRTDSLAAIRKYRESKRYKDSVYVARQERLDSMREARKAFADSVFAVRKAERDSINAARKHVMDSTIAVRNKYLDSVKAVRKVRMDSLAKLKADRERKNKAQQNLREEKAKMALELRIKQKREKWSNEKMLKKRWAQPRRAMQNTFTHYNYYFNADRKMDEALANMLRVPREDYDSLIGLYPFDPNRDSTLLGADMDSIIRKVSVGVQIHDPRVKWADDMYLLLGQSYYYKGGYDNAAISFQYVISMQNKLKPKNSSKSKSSKSTTLVDKEKKGALAFLKHKPVRNEAILWLSRTYVQAGQIENAESILSLLESDPNLPAHLKGRLALEKAFVHLRSGNRKDAAKQLSIAVEDKNLPNWIRQRSAYLSGQLYQLNGDYATAATSFRRVRDFNPKIDMDFYARKYNAYNTMYAGGDVNTSFASLKKMLNDNKYAPYHDQVYFVLGQLAVGNNKPDEAITYLNQSIHTSKATKKQKALSYASLGTVYYNIGNYVASKQAYDSAALLAKYAGNDSSVQIAIRRSNVLGEVSTPALTIRDQDSLLALALLDKDDQRSAVRRYIKMLRDRRADSIYKAENAGINNLQEEQNNNNSNTSWYFSSVVTMQQGFNEFKRKWGNRPLADNWRRMSALGATGGGNGNNANTNAGADTTGNQGLDEDGLPTEESLLASIPNTPEQKEKARKLLERAFIDLANAYTRELEDYEKALSTLDTLDARYPGHEHKAQDIYLRYIIALRQQRLDDAKKYSEQILQQYPRSQYAELVRPSEDKLALVSLIDDIPAAEYYDTTYNMVQRHEYETVLKRMQVVKRDYKEGALKNRFTLVEAMALVGVGDYDMADTLVSGFLRNYPTDSLRIWAGAIMKYISTNRPPPLAPKADTAASGSDTAGSKKSVAKEEKKNEVPATYVFRPMEPHYCIVFFPAMEARTMGVKAAVSDFNTFKYSKQNLATAIEPLTAEQSVLIVKQFPNMAQAKSYANALRATSQIFREYKSNEYQLMIISAANYLKLMTDHIAQPYISFYNARYR